MIKSEIKESIYEIMFTGEKVLVFKGNDEKVKQGRKIRRINELVKGR